jgi:hypothetical protein
MKNICKNINRKIAEIFGSLAYFANTQSPEPFMCVRLSKISLYSNSFQTPNLKYSEANITEQIFFYTHTKPSSIYDGFIYFLTYYYYLTIKKLKLWQ